MRITKVSGILLFCFISIFGFNGAINLQAASLEQDLSMLQEKEQATYNNLNLQVPDYNDIVPDSYKKGVTILNELTEKRTEKSISYRNSDDSITTIFSNSPINYLQGGKWSRVDTTLVDDQIDPNNSFAVLKNKFKVHLGKRSHEEVTIGDADLSITYEALKTNKSKGYVSKNTITYNNTWQDTDLIYTVNSDHLKMFLFLKDKTSPKTFSFHVKTQNASIKQNEDNSIDFINRDGRVVYSIPQLWIQESGKEEHLYGRVIPHVVRTDKSSIITFNIDDKNLHYPLIVDPTTVRREGTYDTSANFYSLHSIDTPSILPASIQNIVYKSYKYQTSSQNTFDPSCACVRTIFTSSTTGADSDVYLNKTHQSTFSNNSRPTSNNYYLGKATTLNSNAPAILTISGSEIRFNLYTLGISTFNGGTLYSSFNPFNNAYMEITYNDTDSSFAPQNINASEIKESSFLINWSRPTSIYASSGFLGRYEVYRDGNLISSILPTSATNYSLRLEGLIAGTIYKVEVRAIYNISTGIISSGEVLDIKTRDPVTFIYDSNGRLDYIKLPDGRIIDYVYDSNGNLLFKKIS
ncbi:fibronectin type III domain-containing protein [Paenibacillus sp. CF384]|uniref:fibronectin type III domain-containing protein n=1 Tax=Paenibacillus sp. CF384 TaxID=1884382 RepID=UPI00115FF64A|nr:fibronectin type III domain-containing protein [Paenibacillus sp. CF384]